MSLAIQSAREECIPELISEGFHKSYRYSYKMQALCLASYMTEPVCKVREYFYSFYILDKASLSQFEKLSRVAFLSLGIIFYSCLVPLTAPLGVALRVSIAYFENKPFVSMQRGKGIILPKERSISLVSYNVCYMPAGYSITDGQVTPPSDPLRKKGNLDLIKTLNPDVICLYEVPDPLDAKELSNQLKDYPFVVSCIGTRGVGPSSMMFIASRYEIDLSSLTFYPFIKEVELTGRAKFSEKGFVVFDLKNPAEKKPFATMISTHLQHSEIPSQPTALEVSSREAQMRKIANVIHEKITKGLPVILTGDLNQNEQELTQSLNHYSLSQYQRDPSAQGCSTWGGDAWCSDLMNKTFSSPMVLDYTLGFGSVEKIETFVHSNSFESTKFKTEALSDHHLLYSVITI